MEAEDQELMPLVARNVCYRELSLTLAISACACVLRLRELHLGRSAGHVDDAAWPQVLAKLKWSCAHSVDPPCPTRRKSADGFR